MNESLAVVPPARAGRSIAVFFDGTNNQITPATDVHGTNVIRLYQAMPEQAGPGQFAHYIPGVGTLPSSKMRTGPGRRMRTAIDKAIGTGLKRDVMQGYTYLMRHYLPGDQIFIFGFSRGAYSARALAALLDNFGLIEGDRESLAEYAMEYFWRGNRRKRHETKDYVELARRFKEDFSQDVQIQCLGVWDTVSAIGAFARLHKLKGTDTLPNVVNAFHAVSIDERRVNFRPYHWRPEIEAATHNQYHTEDQAWATAVQKGTVTTTTPDGTELSVKPGWWTVWFPGVHSDVGGSPEDHHLADITLRWMASMVERAGLNIDWKRLPPPDADAPQGKIYDYWKIIPWGPWKLRTIPTNALVHSSAMAKIVMDPQYKKRHDRRIGIRRRSTPLRQWISANQIKPAVDRGVHPGAAPLEKVDAFRSIETAASDTPEIDQYPDLMVENPVVEGFAW